LAIISIFSAAFCHGDEIADALVREEGLSLIDGNLLGKASHRFGTPQDKLLRAMEGPPFVFNKYTHRREQLLVQIKTALAEMLSDRQIIHGYAAHLIPTTVKHVLRVCLLADPEWRAAQIASNKNTGIQEARSLVREEDKKRAQWTHLLFGVSPWDKTLYDVRIPVNETGIDGAVKLIVKNAGQEALLNSEAARNSLQDFSIATRAEMALVKAKHYHKVSCTDGVVNVIVNEYVLLLERLESNIKRVLKKVEGVSEVCVKTGPNYRPSSVFANVDFELPEKVLLVDDEKDFIMTLSERLEMRDLQPAMAYSGEEALNLIKEEAPDVMVLDLKMPGIDGFDVLKQVKAEHPQVEVIILTGHGNQKDKELCMELGAFAYLEKPVDIDVLSKELKRAKESILADLDQ
jgi:two-component system, OmpR family, response regulator CpxR